MTPAPFQIVQEIINGSLLLLNIYLVWSFISNADTRKPLRSWRTWRGDPAVRGAIALGFYFLGAAILRAWEWLFTFLHNHNIKYDQPSSEYLQWLVQQSWPILLVGGAITYLGGLCIVRVFNPHARVRWLQYVVAAISIAVPVSWHIAWNGMPW